MMNGIADRQAEQHGWHGQRARRWRWQAAVMALLAVLVVQWQPVAAYSGQTGLAARAVDVARRLATPDTQALMSAGQTPGLDDAQVLDGRPDFGVTFTRLDDVQAGSSFTYTVQVRNDGAAGGAVSLSAVLPPELSNVRVVAPGFACTRRFTASGADAGTRVTCIRNDLDGGAVADVTIEAQAPSTSGAYRLTATADPRDEVAEVNETNNGADVTIQVHS
jgi:hypothetical protein